MKRSLTSQVSAFILVRTLMNTAVRMVYPFLPVFGRGLGVGLPSLSLALTLRSAVGIFGPFLASIADSRGRKIGMLSGLGLFIIGVGLLSFRPTVTIFVLMLILTILGNLVFVPAMQAYLGDWVPYQNRGLVLGLTELGWSLSFILGVPLVGLILDRGGWQVPFPILAILGVLALFLISYMIPRETMSPMDNLGLFRNLKSVLTYSPALAGIAMGMTLSCSNELINLVFGVWIEEAFNVKLTILATASVVIGVSELIGEILVSLFADRLGKSRAVAVGLIFNTLAALGLSLLGSQLVGALVGLFLLYTTFEFTIVSSMPMMTEVMPKTRATLMASFIAFTASGRAIGDILAPWLYRLGQSSTNLPDILFISIMAALLNLVALFALKHVKIYESQAAEVA